MRILLAQNAPFYPSHAGASRSDYLMIAALAQRGHRCRVLARIDERTPGGHAEYLRMLAARNLAVRTAADGMVAFSVGAIDAHVATTGDLRRYAIGQLTAFEPDVVLTSTDPLNVLIDDLVRARPKAIVYVARTTTLLPFGPHSAFPSTVKTEAIHQASAVVAVSRYLADYMTTYGGIEARCVPIQLMEPGEWPALGDVDNPFITMVNPCGLKGIAIFVALADAWPAWRFAAVPTWGTTKEDLAQLRLRPNISLMEPTDDIREILRYTKVMLVPSLWPEARGRIIVESLLSGVPVLASDLGGIREAAMDLPCLIPVRPIISYERHLNDRLIRAPETPPQDLQPWSAALRRLVEDRQHYRSISQRSREAATRYASALDVGPLEALLEECVRQPAPSSVRMNPPTQAAALKV